MNIVFFSPIEVLRIDGGAPNRIFHLAKTISDMGENVYLILNSKNEGIRKIDNLSILSCPFVKGKLPKLPQILSKLNLVKEFKKINRKIDIIQYEFPYDFPWVYLAKLYSGAPIVLDEHGIEINYVREAYRSRPSMFRKASVFLRELVSTKLSSHIFVCSKVDLEQLARIYKIPKSKITEIPNAVNQGFFEEIDPYKFEIPTVLFLGGFKHPPNYYAAKALKEVIIPQVVEKEKDVQFVCIGQEPPAWLENIEHVKVLGYVPDVRSFVKGADICVAPIFHGSGTRLKILEYMALGKPVISTSKGAEGIEIVNGENIIIEDDTQKFAEDIVFLLHDATRAKNLGENARKLVKEKYTWERVSAQAIEVYKKLTDGLE